MKTATIYSFPGKYLLNFLLILTFLSKSGFAYTLKVPKIANTDNLSSAYEFAENFESFAGEFSKSYSDSMVFSSKLGEQIGLDSIKPFPHFLFGFNTGISMGKTKGLAKNEATKKMTDGAIPAFLPTLTPTIFLGTGITESWDVRLKMFPSSTITLPDSFSKSSDLNASIKMSVVGISSKYHLLPHQKFMPGVSLGGGINYYSGEITIEKKDMEAGGIKSSKANAGTINGSTYDMTTKGKWSVISFGPEIKVFLDLVFFVPYIGYGVSFNLGDFTTSLNIDGKIQIESSEIEDSSLSLKVKQKAYASPLNHRLILGAEFSLFIAKLGVETLINLGSRTIGLNIGMRIQF